MTTLLERLRDSSARYDAESDRLCLEAAVYIQQLEKEIELLQNDAERLDFIEQATSASWTGVSFDYIHHTEESYVIERGFRMLEYHKSYARKITLREAIDEARGVE